MKRTPYIVIVVLILGLVSPANAATKITPGTKCTKSGLVKNYAGKKYSCIKLGTKLYWSNGVSIKKETPSAINGFTSKNYSGGYEYNFAYSANYPVLNFEVGYAFLKSSGLDPYSDNNYEPFSTYRVTNSNSFRIEYSSLSKLFVDYKKNVKGQALSISVRASTTGGLSPWAEGYFIKFETIDGIMQKQFLDWLDCNMKNAIWDEANAKCIG